MNLFYIFPHLTALESIEYASSTPRSSICALPFELVYIFPSNFLNLDFNVTSNSEACLSVPVRST